ncbi:MAG: hypothetical protein OSB12_10005, partial [Planctomycetota bacterium]|nr:hypothetical protein [Planctomycetota bacterium]
SSLTRTAKTMAISGQISRRWGIEPRPSGHGVLSFPGRDLRAIVGIVQGNIVQPRTIWALTSVFEYPDD